MERNDHPGDEPGPAPESAPAPASGRLRWRTRLTLIAAAAILSRGAFILPSPAQNALVTRDNASRSYLRFDGGADSTTVDCSEGRREQNEPAVAIDPRNTDVLVAGANDACAAMVNDGNVWVGYYRSTDGGISWRDSLVPGYLADLTPAGERSPARGLCSAASDPTMSFDGEGRLFYGFICFGRHRNRSGVESTLVSAMVATYDRDGSRYVRTVLVAAGTRGFEQDKVNLTVDQTQGPGSGNVYLAWVQIRPSGARSVMFSRSLTHGRSFSAPLEVARADALVGVGTPWAVSPDLAVGPNGAVYLTFRRFSAASFRGEIMVLRSTDHGVSFGAPVSLGEIDAFDSGQFAAFGNSVCGDGRYRCAYTYARFDSKSAVAADGTGVHLVWSARLGSGQAKIFVRNSPTGRTWSPPRTLDTFPAGHQWDPDIASADGVITVVFYDSRADGAYATDLPPGNTRDAHNSGPAVDAYVARSRDGGKTWAERRVSTVSSNFDWETPAPGLVPFWGDYIYVSAVPGAVEVVWTDSRDIVPGADPREHGKGEDGDGFDVYAPCSYYPESIDARAINLPLPEDPCFSRGGNDENIYAARI